MVFLIVAKYVIWRRGSVDYSHYFCFLCALRSRGLTFCALNVVVALLSMEGHRALLLCVLKMNEGLAGWEQNECE